MKCDYVNLFLYDYIDGYLPEAQRKLIHHHLLTCRKCANTVLDQQELNHSLQTLSIPEPADSFNQAALARTVQYYEKAHQRKFLNLTSLALAASVFFVAITGFLLTPALVQNNGQPISIAESNSLGKHLNLVFNSPKTLEYVTFTVILPDDVELKGHPGKRKVIWNGQLQAGQNLLSLPIVASKKTAGTLITIIDYENNSKMFEVKLENTKLLT